MPAMSKSSPAPQWPIRSLPCSEGLHLPEQGGVPRFAGVLREDRHGVAAGEHQRTELPFAAFQLGDRGVRREPDARIGPDFPAAGDGEQGEGNVVFEEGFQILEQARPVHGIDGQNGCFLCHGRKCLNDMTVIFGKFLIFAYKYTPDNLPVQEVTSG